MEQYKHGTGTTLHKTAVDWRNAMISAAEQVGEIRYERKGRHFVRKATGMGGVAGYLRSAETMCPAEFHALVRKVYRSALMS